MRPRRWVGGMGGEEVGEGEEAEVKEGRGRSRDWRE